MMKRGGVPTPSRARAYETLWARGVTHAALIGLLVQAAVATVLLRFWLQNGTSFYLLSLGGAGTPLYVAQLVAWMLGFVLLVVGHKRDATAFVGLAALLGIVNFVFNTVLGGDWLQWRLTVGMTLLGLVPAACLLVSRGYRLPASRRGTIVWLGALAAAALTINLLVHNPVRLSPAASNALFGDGRLTLVEVLVDAWWVGVAVGLVAWWRAPWVSLAIAILTLPVLVIRSAPVFGHGVALSGPALPGVVAVVLVVLAVAGHHRLER